MANERTLKRWAAAIAAGGTARAAAACFGLAAAWIAVPAAALDPAGIELHYRSAESLIPVLRPLAAPALLDGTGAVLRVLAAPADLARVQRLAQQADHAPAALSLSIRDDPPPAQGQDEAPTTAAADSAPADDRSVTLGTGRPLPPDRHGNAQILGTGTRNGAEVAMEGEPLRISLPGTQSLRFRTVPPAGSPGPRAGGVVHFDAASDVIARIWLVGDTVAVDVQPQLEGQVQAGAYEPAQAVTIYGHLGQWFALADSGRPLQPGATASAKARTGLWIKVQSQN